MRCHSFAPLLHYRIFSIERRNFPRLAEVMSLCALSRGKHRTFAECAVVLGTTDTRQAHFSPK